MLFYAIGEQEYLQENTCVRATFHKVAALRLGTLLKRGSNVVVSCEYSKH